MRGSHWNILISKKFMDLKAEFDNFSKFMNNKVIQSVDLSIALGLNRLYPSLISTMELVCYIGFP